MESGRNRRSSILKPQKTRNPLSDLDFTEAVEDISAVITGRPSMRRVSFAASNFVKEFATDPEKNTIWDSTYEETVNSDSTQSSENVHNTLGMQHTQCSDSAQITNENIQYITMSNNEDLTLSSTPDNLNPVYALCIEETGAKTQKSIVVTKERTSTTTVNSIQQLHTRKTSINFIDQGGEDIKADSSLFDIGHSRNLLEKENVLTIGKGVTRILPTDKENISFGAIRKGKSGVAIIHTNKDLTGAFSSDKENRMHNHFLSMTPQFSSEVKLSNSSTEVDQSLNKENINTLSNDVRFISNKRNIKITNDNMKVMPSVNLSTESDFRSCKNMTVTDNTSMEFTRHISRSNNSSYKVYGNRTVMSDISMDITRHVVSQPITNTEVVENRTITSEDDMDFTQQLTDVLEKTRNTLAVTDDNMELTHHISSLNKTMKNETIMSEDNMEYTRAVGVINKTGHTPNKTVTSSDEVEFTATLSKEEPQDSSSKSVSDIINIEFIQEFPVVKKPNFESSRNKTTIQDENMELTQQLDVLSKTDSNIGENKFEISGMDMEFSEASLKISNREGTSNKTFSQDENYELTKATDSHRKTDSILVEKDSKSVEPIIELAALNTLNAKVIKNQNISVKTNDFKLIPQPTPEATCENAKTTTVDVTGNNFKVTPQPTSVQTSFRKLADKQQISNDNMQFKEVMSTLNKSHGESIKNKTIDAMNDMENLPWSTLLENSLDQQQNMDFTEVISDLNKSKYEYTKIDSADMKVNKFTPQPLPLQRSFRNSGDNKQISHVNMEFTEVIATLNKSSCEDPKNDTIEIKDNKELTARPTPLQRSFRNSPDKHHISDVNIEFGEVISALNKSNYEGTKNDIDIKDDIEFTIKPAPLQRSVRNSTDKQQTNDVNLEFSAFNKSNYEGTKNDSINMEDDMEFTPQPTPLQRSFANEAEKNDSSDMKFTPQPTPLRRSFRNSADTQQASDVNMEFTELISALNKPNYEGTKNDSNDVNNDMEFTPQPTPLRRSFRNLPDTQQTSDVNMEFTEVISALNKSNYGGTKNDSVDVNNDMEFTPQPTPLRRSFRISPDMHQTSDVNMEFTEVMSALNKSNYRGIKNNSSDMKDDMKCPPQPTPSQISFTNSADTQQTSDINMELTEVMSALNKSNHGGKKNNSSDMKDDMKFPPSTPSQISFTNSMDKQQTSDINMEFTEVMSGLNKSNYGGIKNNSSDMKCPPQPTPSQISFTNSADKQQTSDINMEFTEVMSALNKSNYGGIKNNSSDMKFPPSPTPSQISFTNSADKHQTSDINMEFTEVMSALNKSNYGGIMNNSSDMKDDMKFSPSQISFTNSADKQQTSDINMEFTEVMSALNKSNYGGIMNNSSDMKDDMKFSPSQISFTNSADKQQTSDINMEFTEVMSALNKSNYGGIMDNSSDMKDGMKCPQPTPPQISFTNPLEKQQTSDYNMEFTEVMSALNKSNYGGTKNDSSDMKDDMKCPPQPTPSQISVTNPAEKQQASDYNMEFTQVMSALNKSNYGGTKNDSSDMKDDMKFPPQPTPSQISFTNSADKQQTSDINMEFTEVMSALNKSNYGGTNNDSIGMKDDMKYTPQSTSLQISFPNSADKKEASGVNMEFTEVISALNKSNDEATKCETVDVNNDMEFTPRPTPLKGSFRKSSDKQQTSDVNMEFTKVKSDLNKSNYEGTKKETSDVKENHMEFSFQPTSVQTSFKNAVNNEQISDVSMEFTLNKPNPEGTNDEIVNEKNDYKVFTIQPTSLQMSCRNSGDKQLINNDSMKFSEVISTVNKSNSESISNETGKDDIIEITVQPSLSNKTTQLQMGDTELVLASSKAIPDDKSNEAAMKDSSIQFTQKPSNEADYKNLAKEFESKKVTVLQSGLDKSNLNITKDETVVKNIQRDQVVIRDNNMRFTPELTFGDKKMCRNVEKKFQMDSTDMELTESIPSLSKADFRCIKSEDMNSDNIDFTSHHSSSNKRSFENIKSKLEMDSISTECIQLSSTLNRSVFGGTRNKTISEEGDLIAPPTLCNTDSKSIENQVQVSDTELVCVPNETVPDIERNKVSVKENSIEFTSKPLIKAAYKNTTNEIQMSHVNMELTDPEFGLNISNQKVEKTKTTVKDVQRNEAITKDIKLTPVDNNKYGNMEHKPQIDLINMDFTEAEHSLSKADFKNKGSESTAQSNNAGFAYHQSPFKKSSSENIEYGNKTTSKDVEPWNKFSEEMSDTSAEYIQLPSTSNKSLLDGTRKETISKEDNQISVAQPLLCETHSKNIENKLVFAANKTISDSKGNKTCVKDISIESFNKAGDRNITNEFGTNNVNLGLEFNLNKSNPKVVENTAIVKDNTEVIQYLHSLNEETLRKVNMQSTESSYSLLHKSSSEVVQNKSKCELPKNSSKMNCESMENTVNTTNTNIKLNHQETASKDVKNFNNDNERIDCYETSLKVVNKNENPESIQSTSRKNYVTKRNIGSDIQNVGITLHSSNVEPVATDFHKAVFHEQLDSPIESNKYNVAQEIENHSTEISKEVLSNESFAMDVDITPAKDNLYIKFSYLPAVNIHNINVTMRADKKKSIKSGLQSPKMDLCLESDLSAASNDCVNKVDLQLKEEVKDASFSKNRCTNLFENSLLKLGEDNCASINKSNKQENVQLSESSKHFDTSIVGNEDGQITNSTSLEQALTGLRNLDAQTVSTRANTVAHSICEFKTPGSSFHTSFMDDTQHLINYSLSNKQPKSDFSKIITGDLNPTFLSSKFMHLSDFSSYAFPMSLDNTRNNQTHLDCTQLDKDKSSKSYYDDKPKEISYSVDSKTDRLYSDTPSVLQETSHSNQTDLNCAGVTANMSSKNIENKPQQTTFVISDRNNKTYTLENTINQKPEKEMAKEKCSKEFNDNQPHQVTYLINDKDNSSVKVEEIIKKQKRKSSESIEAAVECKKMLLDTTENLNIVCEPLEMETSFNEQIEKEQNPSCSKGETLNISQENITLSNSIDDSFLPISVAAQQVIGNITRSFNSPSIDCTDSDSEIIQNHFSSRSKALWETYLENNSRRNTIEEFMMKTRSQLTAISKYPAVFEEKCGEAMKKLHIPFKRLSFVETQGSIGSSMEYSSNEPTMNDMIQEENLLEVDNNLNMEIEKVLTLEEEIEKKCRRSKRYWSIFTKEENKYEFYTLYKTIRLVVYFNMETGIVNATDVYSHLADESDPVALFVHRIFKERLLQKNIKLAVGDKYDILSLLDYVYMNMQKMLDIVNELDRYKKSYAMKMDRDFRVTFTMINIYLVNTWCISVDMSDIENITENSVNAWAKVGTVKEAEIKNLVKTCPRGVLFLQSFINKILVYVDILKKRKALLKMKMGNVG